MPEPVSLGEAYPVEQERCRELLLAYAKIGPAGAFGLMSIKAVLREADEASVSGDPVRMLRAFDRMKGCA